MNLGELRSNSPNFRDEITINAIRNRIVDVNRPHGGATGYTATEKRWRSSFISSISGHTFYTVAVLEHYAKTHRNPDLAPGEKDPILERDINNYLTAYVGTYAKRGYHSMHEVLDVLREPNIVQAFKDVGVDLNVTIKPILLSHAMNDALAYSKAVSIRNVAQEIIKAKVTVKEMMEMPLPALKGELKGIAEVINSMDAMDYVANRAKAVPYERILRELNLRHADADIKRQTQVILKKIEGINFTYKVETAIRTKNEAAIRRLLSDPLVKRNLSMPSVFGDQLIHICASNGYNDLVVELIKLGVDKNNLNGEGKTALIIAAEKGNIELVTKLLDLGASPTIRDKEGETAFSSAIKLNHVPVAEKLLTKDAVVATLNTMVDESYLINEAAYRGNKEMVSLLLKNGADPMKLDTNGVTSIVYAAISNNVGMVEIFIEAMKDADEEAVQKQLQNALVLALSVGKLEVIDKLIEAGADINKPNEEGIAPIFRTLSAGRELALEFLLKRGVDVSATFEGKRAYDYIVDSGNPELMRTYLNFLEPKEPEPITFLAKATTAKKEVAPIPHAPRPPSV